MKKRLFFVVLLVCALGTATFSQTLAALDLYKERLANGQAFETRYFGKTITVKGKIWRVSPNTTAMPGFKNHHQVAITGTGYESFIVCQIPFEQKELVEKLSTGQEITVTGTYNERLLDYVVLNDCQFGTPTTEETQPQETAGSNTAPDDNPLSKGKAQTQEPSVNNAVPKDKPHTAKDAQPQKTANTRAVPAKTHLPSKKNQPKETAGTNTASKDIPVSTKDSKPQETIDTNGVPEDIPFGTYRVLQRGMFQYKFTLGSYTTYEMNGKTGTVAYDRATKTIRFTSGALKGFVGLYRPVNPTNPNDPPTIVIDYNGNIPVLGRVNDPYQYGYWQE